MYYLYKLNELAGLFIVLVILYCYWGYCIILYNVDTTNVRVVHAFIICIHSVYNNKYRHIQCVTLNTHVHTYTSPHTAVHSVPIHELLRRNKSDGAYLLSKLCISADAIIP